MAKFKNKNSDEQVEAITFDELVEHGKANCDPSNIHNGMPWSFKLGEHGITHENDKCYLIPTSHLAGPYPYSNFTPDDMLLIGVVGELTPIKKEEFEKEFEKIDI